MVDGKVWVRSGMQVNERSGEVIGRDLRGMFSSTVHVGGMFVNRRSGWVITKYTRGLLSLAVLKGCSR